jgi:uncharacterized protein
MKIEFRPLPVLGSVALAAALWFATFYLSWGNFWMKISLSSAALAFLSLCFQKGQREPFRLDGRAMLLGFFSAVVLYFLFAVGKITSNLLLPFAEGQISGIYAKGEGTPLWIIFLLLLFVTGPCEELYWRGFLQRQLMGRFGNGKGFLLAAAVYAGVHVWSFNFILIGAAGVAGAFWGALYWRLGNLAPVIVSHSLWSSVVFTLFPLI